MQLLRNALLALGLALTATAARAESATVLTVLEQIPADPALYGRLRLVDFADIAALKAAAGVPAELRLADLKSLPEDQADTVIELLQRLSVSVQFRSYLLSGAAAWPTLVGVDFLELDWVAEPGFPPHWVLFLGGEAAPQGVELEALLAAGLTPLQYRGVPVWIKGEDARIDLENRNTDFPFWGWLGTSVRIYRGEAALVGARAWADLDLALAVEQGRAESLADLPRFRLAAAAAADPALSAGPILQMTFVDESFGEGALGPPPASAGLPPYGLLGVADRQDETGQQVVLAFTYATLAEAEAALPLAAAALEAWRDRKGNALADRFPGLATATSVLQTADGTAAVLRLATPPEPARDKYGKPVNRSRLYAQFLQMLMQRDLGLLAPRR